MVKLSQTWGGPRRESANRTATGEMVGALVRKLSVVPRAEPHLNAPTPSGITPQEQMGRIAPTVTARRIGLIPLLLKLRVRTPIGTNSLIIAAMR
jgi:hypothetical protein